MACRRVRALLPRYVDGDLCEVEMAQVARHLEACPACRRRLEAQRRLPRALAALPPPEGAAAAEARLRARVHAGVAAAERRHARWHVLERCGDVAGWLAVSAVALLLVLGVVLSGRPLVAERLAAAPSPGSTIAPAMARYESPNLGFALDYPAAWRLHEYAGGTGLQGQRTLGGVGFTSDGYAGDSQAFGRYAIGVTVSDAGGRSVAEAVEAWLAPIDPGYRARVEQQATTLAGELAVELSGLPGERFGARQVWVIHGGRLYVVGISPAREDLSTPADVAARAAFEACLRGFAFIPATQTPVPPTAVATPAPTPTAGPEPSEEPALSETKGAPALPTPTPAPTLTPATVLPPYARPVTSLVVTPDDPPLVYAVIDGRLYKSDDRGLTWQPEPADGLPDEAAINAVAVDYRHPATVYLLAAQGIYRRQGAGAWQRISELQATALAVDMADPTVLWAGVRRSGAGEAVILKSPDGGATWAPAGPLVEVSPWGTWVSDILVNPNDPNMLWAVVRSNRRDLPPDGLLYRGTRDGRWQRLDLGAFAPQPGNPDGVHVAGIAYDPNADLLYAGSERDEENGGRILLIRSPNAAAASAAAVRWDLARYTALPLEPCAAPGLIRPLAVDARRPRALYAASDIVWCGDESPLDRHRLLVSHDDGANWDTLTLEGKDE